jgi:hypothetical protein
LLEVQGVHWLNLNPGNDRWNIMPIVQMMEGGKVNFGSLDFLPSGGDILRTDLQPCPSPS